MNPTLTEPISAAPGPPRAAKTRWGTTLWRALITANFLALIGVALVLRCWQLGNIPGLNGDEAWLGVQAAHLAAGDSIAWRTPTGNPVNPFLLLPTAALHLVFGPSVAVLRLVALASGMVALGANFWLCRRVFDRRTALVSTAVLAVLPIAIAYSRFAWDTSQTILATVLVLYLALANVDREVDRPGKIKKLTLAGPVPPDWLPAFVAFGAAIWIHPTNVFAVWLLVVPAVYRYGSIWRERIGLVWEQTQTARSHWLNRLSALATFGVLVGVGGWICRGLLWTAGARLFDPQQGGLYLRRLVRLFSGGTIFEFIPGPGQTTTALDGFDTAFVLLAFVAALGLCKRLHHDDSGRERCLAWAVALMLGSFYLVAGPGALAPHFERYGMCLVTPGGVLLALGLSYWLGIRELDSHRLEPSTSATRGGWRRIAQARVAAFVLAALAWLWLALFYRDYFLEFGANGGTSHMAFRTAAIEPKLAALHTIIDREYAAARSATEGSPRTIWVVADSWWSYWPLAYFSAPRHDIRVVAEEEWPAASRQVGPADALWRVKFVAADATGRPIASAVAEDWSAGKTTIRDYAGVPILTVQRLDPLMERPAAEAP